MIFSGLITNAYLGLMTAGFAYFAWFNPLLKNSDPPVNRCYATQNKAETTPWTEDGENRHDITTDFQLVNNFGAIIFGIAFLMYFFICVTRKLHEC